jgi:hypothetical protein
VIRASGKLTVSGGPLAVNAGSVTLEPNGEILGLGGETGSNIAITTTGDIRVQANDSMKGRIDTSAAVNPGQIDLTAGGAVDIDGFLTANGTSVDGGGGVLNVTAAGDVSFDGAVKFKGGDFNLGGFLTVRGRNVSMNGLVDVSAADGGIIDVDAQGTITQAASGDLVLKGRGGFGDAGELDLIARGDISLAGQITAMGAGTYASGW